MTREEQFKLILTLISNEPNGVTIYQIMQELRINAYDEANGLIEELVTAGDMLTLQNHGEELIYLSPEHVTAVHATKQSAGADVFASDDQVIKSGSTVLLESSFKLPEYLRGKNVLLLALARSSFWDRHQLLLTNGVGLIDSDYPDSVFFSYYNMGDKDVTIERGDKVGQLVLLDSQQFAPVLQVERNGGFGSTNELTDAFDLLPEADRERVRNEYKDEREVAVKLESDGVIPPTLPTPPTPPTPPPVKNK